MSSITVRETLPLTKDFISDVPKWGRILPLIHPLIRPFCASSNTFVRDDGLKPKRGFTLAYVSSEPSAFIRGKVEAWSCEEFILSSEFESALTRHGRAVLIRTGTKRGIRETGTLTILEGGNEVEAELFVNVLSCHTPSTRLEAVIEALMSTTQSVMSFLSTRPPQGVSEKSNDTAAARCYWGSKSSVVEFGSVKDLVRQLFRPLLILAEPNTPGVQFSHVVNLNGLSQIESWTLAGAASDALQVAGVRAAPVNLGALSYPSLPEKGFGLATILLSESSCDGHFSFPSDSVHIPSPVTSSNIHGSTSKSAVSLPSPEAMDLMIHRGCKALIAEEPAITRYDTLTGDGDCGLTLSFGAKRVLDILPTLNLSNLSVALSTIVDSLESSMGGTSGALYCIFLSALAAELEHPSNRSFPQALEKAKDQLFTFTRARPGDRTCIDVLMPFVDTLAAGLGVNTALQKAHQGAERTKWMEARMGRAIYLSSDACEGVPDAGAWGLAVLLQGMCSTGQKCSNNK